MLTQRAETVNSYNGLISALTTKAAGFEAACASDAKVLCHTMDSEPLFDCLYAFRSKVGTTCSIALLASTIGRCNNNAWELCSAYSIPEEIRTCLLRHMDQVEPDCRTNLLRGSNADSLASVVLEKDGARLTLLLTVCSVYLAIALLSCLWLWYMATAFRKQLLAYPSRITVADESHEVQRDMQNATSAVLVRTESLEYEQFVRMSTRRSQPTFARVGIELRRGTVTVVSGTGAARLVDFLGGRVERGVVRGRIAWSGSAVSATKYIKIAREHCGYIDNPRLDQLPPWLTVWDVLAHEAMLRSSADQDTDTPLNRAWDILNEVGLRTSALKKCDSPTFTTTQKLRLLTAVELMASPSMLVYSGVLEALAVDECKALLKLLRDLSRRHHIAVLCDLPIASQHLEVMETAVDNMLLLGSTGHMLCEGSLSEVTRLLREVTGRSAAARLPQLLRAVYGDGDSANETEPADDEGAALLIEGRDTKESVGVEMALRSQRNVAEAVWQRYEEEQSTNSLVGSAQEEESSSRLDLVHSAENSLHNVRQDSNNGKIVSKKQGSPLTQVWGRASMQFSVHWVKRKLGAIACTVTVAALLAAWCQRVSQRGDEAALLAASLLYNSVQCALLVVAILTVLERLREMAVSKSSGSAFAEMLSSALLDLPVAIATACAVVPVLYALHPLNPSALYGCYAVVCLIVGLSAWQAFVSFVTVWLQGPPVIACVVMVLMAASMVMSGQLVTVDSFSWPLRILAYFLIPAVLQRGLVINDLWCCYLTWTCNALLRDGAVLDEDPANCPTQLQFSGNGWDEGNLGRQFLSDRGLLEDRPAFLLFVLFLSAVGWRFAIAIVLRGRQKLRVQLRHITESSYS